MDMSSEEQLEETPTQNSADNKIPQVTRFLVTEDTAETIERTAEPVSRQADITNPSPSYEEGGSASFGATETVQEIGPSSSES